MDKAGPQSLIVVVSYGYYSPYSTSILQLETQGHNPDFAELLDPVRRRSLIHGASYSDYETYIHQKEYVAHFGQPQGPARISWVFSHLSCSTSEELYMVPYWDPRDQKINVPQLHGSIFNFKTKTCIPFLQPESNKFEGHVVNHKGYLYFISPPRWLGYAHDPSFERYNPASDLWETLVPFPFLNSALLGFQLGSIEATAVLDDTILFNVGGFEFWAYSVEGEKWYPVEVVGKQCYNIIGEAVVLGNTIYALTKSSYKSILALSISITPKNGELLFKCRLRSQILVQGMEPLLVGDAYLRTRHLCLLGKDTFCLVESCKLHGCYDYQPIRLTNIKLKEEILMTVTGVRGHLLRILDHRQFRVDFCFSLPERIQTEDKSSVFYLNPFPEGFDPKQKNKYLKPEEEIVTGSKVITCIGRGAASRRGNTDGAGHSIHVRNLSPFATYNQLEKAFKKFGTLEDIKVLINEMGDLFAIVEFDRAASKENAIKASPIEIAGYPTVIT